MDKCVVRKPKEGSIEQDLKDYTNNMINVYMTTQLF